VRETSDARVSKRKGVRRWAGALGELRWPQSPGSGLTVCVLSFFLSTFINFLLWQNIHNIRFTIFTF
jgi:hypothetical protein